MSAAAARVATSHWAGSCIGFVVANFDFACRYFGVLAAAEDILSVAEKGGKLQRLANEILVLALEMARLLC